ncbi:MAG: hypothetical protein R2873_31450 [Caldilineaceae bacterium]
MTTHRWCGRWLQHRSAIILGLALSNGMVGLAGRLIAQYPGFADVNMGLADHRRSGRRDSG